MLPATILAAGSLRERWLKDAAAEYEKRLVGRCKLEILEIPEVRLSERPGSAEIARALAKEADLFRQKIPRRFLVIALCIEGNPIPSEEFAALLETAAFEYPGVAFLIGSSHGLDKTLKQEAGMRLSFSPMTFPHQLARVMLLEQLYRCSVLLSGGKYHK